MPGLALAFTTLFMTKKNKKPTLTQRERESRKASREKARQKKLHACWVRVRLVLAVIAFTVLAGGGGWMWASGNLTRITEKTLSEISSNIYAITAKAGFTLEATYLEGRGRTDSEEIERALGLKKGEAILRISLPDVKSRLEAIPSIKEAAVERSLPHALHIRIREREPAAIWQHEGALSLIDEEGIVMPELALEDYSFLPVLVGKGAARNAREAIALLKQEPELASLVQAVVRVGDRRWNIRLRQGMEVKLPQQKPDQAWRRVAAWQRERQLLMRDIRGIDLREEGKLMLRLTDPSVITPAMHYSHET